MGRRALRREAAGRSLGGWGILPVLVAVVWITGCSLIAPHAADDQPNQGTLHTAPAVDATPSTTRCPEVQPQISVSVDAANIHQTMDGWSTEERLWDDPHLTERAKPAPSGGFVRSGVDIPVSVQNEILDKMYRELRLTQVNPVVDRGSQRCRTCPVDLRWKFADGHIAWVDQARRHGLERWQLFYFALEPWMSFTDPSDLRNLLMVHLRRWRDQGAEPHYVVPFSEPSYNQRGRPLSPVYMRELIRGLGRILAAEGFRTKIVAPDDVNPAASYRQLETIMSDAEVRDYVAVIATHLYGGHHLGDLARIRDRFARPFKKPLWMGEYFRGPEGLNGSAFDYAELMHDLIWTYDVSLVNYEWAYLGQWEDSRIHFIHIEYDAENNYTGYSIDKAYYTFGQFSRFVPVGAKRVDTISTDPTVKVTAYKDGAKVIIVVVNNTSCSKTVSFDVKEFPGLSSLQPVRTTASENWASLPRIALDGTTFIATLPGTSITTFIDSTTSSPDSVADK